MAPVAGLAELLQRAGLVNSTDSGRGSAAEEFCAEWGAVDVQEVVEDQEVLEAFCEHLKLDRLERQRLTSAALVAEPTAPTTTATTTTAAATPTTTATTASTPTTTTKTASRSTGQGPGTLKTGDGRPIPASTGVCGGAGKPVDGKQSYYPTAKDYVYHGTSQEQHQQQQQQSEIVQKSESSRVPDINPFFEPGPNELDTTDASSSGHGHYFDRPGADISLTDLADSRGPIRSHYFTAGEQRGSPSVAIPKSNLQEARSRRVAAAPAGHYFDEQPSAEHTQAPAQTGRLGHASGRTSSDKVIRVAGKGQSTNNDGASSASHYFDAPCTRVAQEEPRPNNPYRSIAPYKDSPLHASTPSKGAPGNYQHFEPGVPMSPSDSSRPSVLGVLAEKKRQDEDALAAKRQALAAKRRQQDSAARQDSQPQDDPDNNNNHNSNNNKYNNSNDNNNSTEKRRDPEDGKAYTLKELQQLHRGSFPEPEIVDYWHETCTALETERSPASKRRPSRSF
ncbi:unnamed protein product [Polarella glacialis]|uniref:Uncharacterized protein n=1 Tax=Polarella glacialis TaxID=89957 RepID=A0A813EN41_POLGL|nr:unnamed protein product [Polarella glacialis]